jgi:REP element-mobilizing transposase RayT
MLHDMPRLPRLDIPDLVHHVIVRGIKRDKIFRDDDDRRNFTRRLHALLRETDTICYAWALIPNHVHILLRPRRVPLSSFMRRLLTGYAVTHNKRHNRSGHLFHNRYKSIICEEDIYLLELIRYIHLNPLRAHLVPDMEALDQYPWCGHAEIMAQQPGCGLDVEGVLSLFGQKASAARQKYRQFVADGMEMGKRPELEGGGLHRSQVLSEEPEEINDFDDRILGTGEFVTALRNKGLLNEDPPLQISLNQLQQIVEEYYQLDKNAIMQRGRMNKVSEARCVFCFCATRQLHNPAAKIARYLGIGPPAVSRAIRKGEKIVEMNHEVKKWLVMVLKQ